LRKNWGLPSISHKITLVHKFSQMSSADFRPVLSQARREP
jgi:hypothetical protein